MADKKIKKEDFDEKKEWSKQSEPEMVDTYDWLDNRIDEELKRSRESVFGKNLDELWKSIDNIYIPQKLSKQDGGTVAFASDDEKGWLSRPVKLGDDDWQSDISTTDFYSKLQTAVSILVERNPEGVFIPKARKFEKNTKLVEALYKDSWQKGKSKRKYLLPFTFNLVKYGWSIGRTYPKLEVRTVADEDGNEREIEDYNGVFREALDPKRCWIDDMAKADDQDSARDWCWEIDYGYDVFKELFPKEEYNNIDSVKPPSKKDEDDESGESYQDKEIITCVFYENKSRDIFAIRANGVWILVDSLPADHKKLSCSWTYCTERNTNTPYGIGLIEAMKESKALKDKLINMTMDQLVLSIYKMFFHTGTDQIDGDGRIEIEPGVGIQVMDPKNIEWMNIPGPGQEAWKGIDLADQQIDEDSGITKGVEGQVTGGTLGEVFQAKEAALKRLKIPLWNIVDALEVDAQLTIALNEQIMSVPEVIQITDSETIRNYMQEIQSDPELFFRKDNEETGEEEFFAKRFPETYINLESDKEGNLNETEDARFFRTKPSGLSWNGIVYIKPQSILEHTKELDKQMTLEMSNLVIPLIQQYVVGAFYLEKPIRQILKIYDRKWEDWMPTQEEQQQQVQQGAPQQGAPQQSGAQTVVPPGDVGTKPKEGTGGLLNRIAGGVRNIFKGENR